MDQSDDKTLIEQIKRQPEAFGQIYDRYFSRVFAYVLKRTLDYHTARDISSEVFLKAFIAIQQYRWKGNPLVVWLYAIAQNEIRLYFRKRSYRPEYMSEYAGKWSTAITPSAEAERIQLENEWLQSEKVRSVIQALNKLNEVQRECVALHYLEGFTYREIAAILSLKVGTVKSHISRGIQRLKKEL